MRRRPVAVAVLSLAVTAALAGCGDDSGPVPERAAQSSPASVAAQPTQEPAPSASPTQSAGPAVAVAPAASAGGLCRRFSYDAVARTVGERFEVAAASGVAGREQTCVLQRTGAAIPDLTLSFIPAETDLAAFRADFQPATARAVPGLGKGAYSRVGAATKDTGPQVEVCWLGRSGVYTLAYTAARSTGPAAAAKVLPGLVNLARTLPR